jgi:hypothetical protein
MRLNTVWIGIVVLVVAAGTEATVTLEGSQTRGYGHTSGELECAGMNLPLGGVVVRVSEPGAGYWLTGPGGIILRFGGTNNGVNTKLDPGTWYAYPNLPAGAIRARVLLDIQVPAGGAGGGGAPSGVSGSWTVTFSGTGGSATTSLVLHQEGSEVTGVLHTTDGTPGEVRGTFDGTTLVLSRETGLETVQHYRVTVSGSRFTGTFHNQGKYPDQGTFEGVRAKGDPEGEPAPTKAPGVVGTWSVTFTGTGGSATTTLVLQQSGSNVTGVLRTTDGTPGQVKGTFDGTTLALSRETGLETVQHYRVTVSGDRFSGTFLNEGRYPDHGTFEGSRP